MTTITTTCSGCDRSVLLNLATAEAHVRFAGNGLHGKKHVAGGIGISEVFCDDSELLTWDCPVCSYADSYEVEGL